MFCFIYKGLLACVEYHLSIKAITASNLTGDMATQRYSSTVLARKVTASNLTGDMAIQRYSSTVLARKVTASNLTGDMATQRYSSTVLARKATAKNLTGECHLEVCVKHKKHIGDMYNNPKIQNYSWG
jgi:hypothetical protein